MPIPSVLAYALTFGVYGKYLLIAAGMLIGGPFLIFASGVLLRLQLLELAPLFAAIVLGELSMDAVWYYVGHFYVDAAIERYGKYIGLTPESFGKIKALFARYGATILFVSKLFMGLGIAIAVLVTAGATRIGLWKYLLYNALGEVLWVSAMLYIGYFYAGLYENVAHGFKLVFLIGTVTAIFALGFGISRYLRKKTLETV